MNYFTLINVPSEKYVFTTLRIGRILYNIATDATRPKIYSAVVETGF